MIINGEQVRIWKEAVVACFNMLPHIRLGKMRIR
jgi:hypothetical protein